MRKKAKATAKTAPGNQLLKLLRGQLQHLQKRKKSKTTVGSEDELETAKKRNGDTEDEEEGQTAEEEGEEIETKGKLRCIQFFLHCF
jgi:hypothetical protein